MKKTQKIGYMALGAVLALALGITIPALAASVQQQITAYYNDIKIYVDGELITPRDGAGNLVEPFVSEGTTYLPVRAVAEALGKTVEWDGLTQSVYIGPRPGAVQYMTDICPAYQSAFDWSLIEYSAMQSGGTERFAISGITYTNGFTMQSGTGEFEIGNYWAVWNLNGQYTSLIGVLGHVDGTTNGDGKLQILCDGVLKQEIPLNADMLATSLNVDVTGANQLKLVWITGHAGTGYGTYGIGNPILQ